MQQSPVSNKIKQTNGPNACSMDTPTPTLNHHHPVCCVFDDWDHGLLGFVSRLKLIISLKQLELWLIGTPTPCCLSPKYQLVTLWIQPICCIWCCSVNSSILMSFLFPYLMEAKECWTDMLDIHLVPPALNWGYDLSQCHCLLLQIILAMIIYVWPLHSRG